MTNSLNFQKTKHWQSTGVLGTASNEILAPGRDQIISETCCFVWEGSPVGVEKSSRSNSKTKTLRTNPTRVLLKMNKEKTIVDAEMSETN